MKIPSRLRFFQIHLVDSESGMDGMTIKLPIKASNMTHIQEKLDLEVSSYDWSNSSELRLIINNLKQSSQELASLIEDYDYSVDEILEITESLYNSEELLIETN